MSTGLVLLAGFAVSIAGSAAASDPAATCTGDALAKSITACDSAIAAERDPDKKGAMLYDRAWAHNERGESEAALRDLDGAIAIDPRWADALHERGFTLVELGEFAAAKRDLDKAIAERDNASDHTERAIILRGTGDLAGSFAETERVVALRPEDAEALLGRAMAALWLGRFEDAARDVELATALARKSSDGGLLERAEDMASQVRLWSARSAGASAERCNVAGGAGDFAASNLIGDCTAAFLAAPTGAEKAKALTHRSLAWLAGQHDRTAAAADREVAVALDPGNADWLFNLGYSYYELGRYEAAVRLFERSLAKEQTAAALAGRGAARYRLGDKDGAREDAGRAAAIKPYPLAFLVLGDLANEAGRKDEARTYWLKAYQTGWRDGALAAHLKSVGVDHPEREPRAQ